MCLGVDGRDRDGGKRAFVLVPGGAAWSATWSFGQLRRRGSGPGSGRLGDCRLRRGGDHSCIRDRDSGDLDGGRSWTGFPFALVCGVRRGGCPVAAGAYVLAKRSHIGRNPLEGGSSARPAACSQPGARVSHQTADELSTVHPGSLGWAEAFVCHGELALRRGVPGGLYRSPGAGGPLRAILVIYGLTQVAASFRSRLAVSAWSRRRWLHCWSRTGKTPPQHWPSCCCYRVVASGVWYRSGGSPGSGSRSPIGGGCAGEHIPGPITGTACAPPASSRPRTREDPSPRSLFRLSGQRRGHRNLRISSSGGLTPEATSNKD